MTSLIVDSPAGGAVVTGAGRGLGLEIARLLVARGHRVLVTDVDGDAAAAAAEEVGAAGSLAVDVRTPDDLAAARHRILELAGSLEVWVNNAGVLHTGPVWEQSADDHRLMIEVNALGTVQGTLAALESMRPAGRGHVVNVVSLAGLTPVPGEAVYAATKHAALGFSLSALSDLRLAGITGVDISCVCPDGIWTPMLHDRLDDPGAALSFSGSLLQPSEVVEAVEKVLDKPRPVTAVPARRGAVARVGALLPSLGLRLMPLVVAQGKRTQKRLRRTGGPAPR